LHWLADFATVWPSIGVPPPLRKYPFHASWIFGPPTFQMIFDLIMILSHVSSVETSIRAWWLPAKLLPTAGGMEAVSTPLPSFTAR
jgi:hypothetical protein